MTLGSHQQCVGKSQVHIIPKWIIDALGPFDLDPAAADARPWDCARINWSSHGLYREWPRDLFVYLNPPFDRREVGDWISRLARHGNGITLLHARTETAWRTDLATRERNPVPVRPDPLPPTGRISPTRQLRRPAHPRSVWRQGAVAAWALRHRRHPRHWVAHSAGDRDRESGGGCPVIIHTPASRRAVVRRLDRRNLRLVTTHGRVEHVLSERARGAALHLSFDRRRGRCRQLTGGAAVDDTAAQLVIKHPDVAGVGDTLFPGFRLSQTYRYIGDCKLLQIGLSQIAN
jgi:hypothetical protein